MDRLPSPEERQWLTHALKKVIARRGGALLDLAPLVEPTNEWFPEPWASTAAHGHRLAQRLMYYAGLSELKVSLSAYQPTRSDGDEVPWDAGTAGWFAGIRDRRAFFGLHVRQFSDPEAAAGVLAHEVAHAWRGHHHLVVDDREKEEPLTDVTTIVLGFGILTTNNTDRYRSSGNWSRTAWSISSVGYLSPQAMSWLLAVWCTARNIDGERRTIERHLEPNQRSYFRASLEELDRSDAGARELLRVAGPAPQSASPSDPASFVPRDPAPDEIDEPVQAAPDRERNRGTVVYQKSRNDVFLTGFVAALPAFFIVWITTLSINDDSMVRAVLVALAGATAAAVLAGRRARRPACSACGVPLNDSPVVCPGCGGTVGSRVTTKQLRRIREEELERRAAETTGYEECNECEPELPCPAHAPAYAIGPEEDDDADSSPANADRRPRRIPSAPPIRVSGRFWRRVAALAAVAAGVTLAVAFWRQTHVLVWFDNPLPSPVTIAVDGETFAIIGRPPVERTLKPGSHRIVVTDANREIERADVSVGRQPLFAALTEPRFYVYSVAGRGTYWRSRLVYSGRGGDGGDSTATIIAMQRWIRQEPVDFLFTKAPDKISGSGSLTRNAFEVADLTLREAAWALERQGSRDEAVRMFRRGLELDRCDNATRQDLVDLFRSREDHDAARREATAWVSACGTSLQAHRMYQDLFVTQRERESLRKIYQERLRRDPSAVNHYLYGRLLHGQPAIAEFTEALRIDPDVPWARIALGRQLLEAEQDLAAYDALGEALRAKEVEGMAVVYFAKAAVAAQKQDEALARLPEASRVDGDSLWTAKWILARSKGDWRAARILLAYREVDQPSAATKILRAALERDDGGAVDALAEELDAKGETKSGAVILRFEQAWETGRLRDAATMDLAPLREKGAPAIVDVYALEAAMLVRLPDAPARAADLRAKLSANPELLALLDAAEGRISNETLMTRIANDTLGLAPHAWFALAVHAALSGGDAPALFHKSATRAFDREFPYRLASYMATHPAAAGSSASP